MNIDFSGLQNSLALQQSLVYALVAPAKTPAGIVFTLNAAVRRTLQSEPTRGRLLASGTEPVFSTPDELAELIRNERTRWSRVIRERKITGD